MNPMPRALAVALAASVLAPCSWAVSNQACAPHVLASLDAWLAKHPWRVGATSPEARIDAACKASPADPSVAIVAAAYRRGPELDKNVVVALVEAREGKILGAFTGVVQEDAAMRVTAGSLRIDTARYDLAPGVRAFGVDLSSSATGPRCAEGGSGPLRTLFVQEGASLRPVLASLQMSSWRLVSGPACPEIRSEDKKDAVIENVATTISVAPHATHGFADLVLTSTIDDRAETRRRLVMRYDGTRYDAQKNPLWPDVIVPETAPPR